MANDPIKPDPNQRLGKISKNAAFLAARIVALTHPEVRERLAAHLQDSKKRYDSPDPSVPGQSAS